MSDRKVSKPDSRRQLMMISGVIIAVVAITAVLWFASSSGNHLSPVVNTTTTMAYSNTSSKLTTYQLSAQDLSTVLAAYPQRSQFTANYTGSIYTYLSTSSNPLTGNLTAEYQRYNNSARSVTSIKSSQAGNFRTAVYYSGNGISYACTANMSANYTCQKLSTQFNASDFGVSIFLAALSNSTGKTITAYNSSYGGIPCIALSARLNNSYNNSGVLVSSTEVVSGCLQPEYRIPIVLNLTTVSTASGSYANGTGRTQIPSVSERLMINLRLVNLTSSASMSDVQNLPANAVVR